MIEKINKKRRYFKIIQQISKKLDNLKTSHKDLLSLREKRLYSEFFWSLFSHIRTEYGEILHISPYSVRMR